MKYARHPTKIVIEVITERSELYAVQYEWV
ncbi:hypothetical protein NSND_62284 [Nitrospira sp. ND1]|nr:hypothetical protein NSND_62284 [Nitrospira sp. ND1]